MAAGGLLALLDDITILADDVAVMTLTATKKTAGIVGDDIAVNAKQVIGVADDRETAVVKKIAKGSAINKAVQIPAFFGMSLVKGGMLIPWALLAGATYLCYEGAEKTLHMIFPTKHDEEHKEEILDAAHHDPEKSEKQKVKAAITTDFVLSAEIMAISLGSIAAMTASPFMTLGALAAVGVITTVGVYSLIWGFVRMDNWGLALSQKENKIAQAIGHGLLRAAPAISKSLSYIGTAAMFTVGGEILMHNLGPKIPMLNNLVHQAEHLFHSVPLGESVVLPLLAGATASLVIYPAVEYGAKPVCKHAITPVVDAVTGLVRRMTGRHEPSAALQSRPGQAPESKPSVADIESSLEGPAVKDAMGKAVSGAKNSADSGQGTNAKPKVNGP